MRESTSTNYREIIAPFMQHENEPPRMVHASLKRHCEGGLKRSLEDLPFDHDAQATHVYTLQHRATGLLASLTRSAIFSLALFSLVVYLLLPDSAKVGNTGNFFQTKSLAERAAVATTPLLNDFQVYPPVLTPTTDPATGSSGCVVTNTLMTYVFANSYGAPFVGPYEPPADCDFNRVIFNLSIVSAGVQFDRLGLVYLGNTEVWRFSTAEPSATGIEFGYVNDMSNFLALLKRPQKLIFDLGNIVDSTYTASYNATLTAQYFTSEDSVKPADKIIPVSARMAAQNSSSAFQVPSQNATNTLTLPRNIDRAVFSLSACGQSTEEFWYGNVQSSQTETFESNPAVGTLYGYSPFREVQLFIDGQLAGVAWPFPIVFTGGIVPGLWRPIVGIDAFDLKEDEIDITPWLPLLCDGNSHSFEIRVAGINDVGSNGTIVESVGNYWIVTGTIFLWLGPSDFITTGSKPIVRTPEPKILLSSSIGTNSTGANKTLTYNTHVKRQISVSSTVKTSEGAKSAFWKQDLSYFNHGRITKFGLVQLTVQNTTGNDYALGYSRDYGYPLNLKTGFSIDFNSGNFSIDANITRGRDVQILGQPVFPTGLQSFEGLPVVRKGYPSFQGSNLQTAQIGTGYYFAAPSQGYAISSGSTQQDMVFTGVIAHHPKSGPPRVVGSRELYERHVSAVNATVVFDNQTLVGQPYHSPTQPPASKQNRAFAALNALEILGRGPGRRTNPS